jgi:hypothetical protein
VPPNSASVVEESTMGKMEHKLWITLFCGGGGGVAVGSGVVLGSMKGVQNHVARVILNCGIWVCRTII